MNAPPSVAPAPTGRADAAATRRLLAGITAWDLDRCNLALPAAIVAGALVVTPSQQDQAFAAHQAAMSLALVLERELVGLHEGFVEAGIDHRVVKGAATARLPPPRRAISPRRSRSRA